MPSATTFSGGRTVAARAGAPLPTRQRRSGFVGLGVVLIVGLAAGGAWFDSRAGAKTPVVVVVRTVPAGHRVTRDDLSTVGVAGGVTAMAGAHLSSAIGQDAAVTLLPNMLLQRSMLAPDNGLAASEAQVGVAVTSGQIPADGLAPGDTVEVVQLPGTSATSGGSSGSGDLGQAQELVPHATVFAVRADPAQAGGTLLTLTVPAAQAEAVATASGAGQVALIRVTATR